ncbi:hypothetical protein AC579_7352 [Pseudocercospora musae]|uniref:Uncharacterized protein n=1 Tax=Pseudocercospora musae TaxID=113226 RepID=A0A139ICM1_9PEZI|nr:hypothetical protein AC579_7352 [Pseudocercospora musae]
MPFFHQNLSPNTMRHGYKLPELETDFTPKTPATTPPSPNRRRSKLKPDRFWTAPAPVWKINYKTSQLESTAEDPFHHSLQPKRKDSHDHLAANRAQISSPFPFTQRRKEA